MILRAAILLVIALMASAIATYMFGQEVLVALGLVLTQAKLVAKKLAGLELSVILAWAKLHGSAFLKVELIKKWVNATLVPVVLGRTLFRRLSQVTLRYRRRVGHRFVRLWHWYMHLPGSVRILATIILVLGTLSLSVTSIGLWLILFSAKLPLWLLAMVQSTIVMVISSVEKSLFRAIVFLQLGWLWAGVKWVLPQAILDRKRRFDYRMIRAIVRRRRLTVRQLAHRKDKAFFRLGVALEFLRPNTRPHADSHSGPNSGANSGS